MKVRTQLLLAFLLLAVLPLSGIVLYSYLSSLGAFREAVWAETLSLAEEMGDQLRTVREDIDQRLEVVTTLPVRSLIGAEKADLEVADVYVDLMTQMGEVAPMVDWLEFSPEVAPDEVGEASESFFIYPSKALAKSLRKLKTVRENLDDSGLAPEYFQQMVTEVISEHSALEEAELEAFTARGQEMKAVLGSEFASPVRQGDRVVGQLKAMVPATAILDQVLSGVERNEGKIPFARDASGALYIDQPKDREILEQIGVTEAGDQRDPAADWIVVEIADEDSGLTFGIGQPIGDSLRGIRGAAVRNFAYGLGMIVLSMIGVVWLSSRMTRTLTTLTAGAERLALGELETRVPIESKDEFGSLARTINRMAEELSDHQARLLEEARLRKDQEMQQKLLAAENERKSLELEEARQLQLSLLPKSLPRHPDLEVAVSMQTATEVGGDYYDFFPGSNGVLTAAIGDAAGHGARAGTMVTVVKGLFTAAAGTGDPPAVLTEATRAIKKMELGRMNMGVALVRFAGGRVTISAAGMPPVFVFHRATATIEEVALPGMPLGGLAGADYGSWDAQLEPEDTLLLMTDGFPELLSPDGEPLGYERARSAFAAAASGRPEQIVSELKTTADDWRSGAALNDDMTFVVIKVRS